LDHAAGGANKACKTCKPVRDTSLSTKAVVKKNSRLDRDPALTERTPCEEGMHNHEYLFQESTCSACHLSFSAEAMTRNILHKAMSPKCASNHSCLNSAIIFLIASLTTGCNPTPPGFTKASITSLRLLTVSEFTSLVTSKPSSSLAVTSA